MAKVVATGALTGAVDAGAKIAGGGNKTKTNVAGVAKKSNPSISSNKAATSKKTRRDK